MESETQEEEEMRHLSLETLFGIRGIRMWRKAFEDYHVDIVVDNTQVSEASVRMRQEMARELNFERLILDELMENSVDRKLDEPRR